MEKENISLYSRPIFPHGREPWELTPSRKWNLALTFWPMGRKLNSPNISPSTGRSDGEGTRCISVCGNVSLVGMKTWVKCFRRQEDLIESPSLEKQQTKIKKKIAGRQDLNFILYIFLGFEF